MGRPTGANQALVGVYDADLDALRTVSAGAFAPPSTADAVTITYPDNVTEIYAFRTGGTGGAVVMTITVIYVDDTKARVLSVARS